MSKRKNNKGFKLKIKLAKYRAIEKVYMDKITHPKKFKSIKDYSRKFKHKQNYEEM